MFRIKKTRIFNKMNFLNNIYCKSLEETEKNIRFWEDYLNNLRSLDFTIYSDKLTVPTLVPIGSRIFFKGQLKHTNELIVALGADYFTKCSLKQAEELRQHRIRVAQDKLLLFKKEQEYIETKLSFTKENVYNDHGQEILEVFTEEEETAWRKKHRENVKKHMRSKSKDEVTNVTDEELWNRLEELELQEELENELLDLQDDNFSISNDRESCIIDEDCVENIFQQTVNPTEITQVLEDTIKTLDDDHNTTKPTSERDMLQKVIQKQNELEEKLLDLRNKERSQSKSEKDLISKLDEMEKLDELEDEIDRLDDILDIDNMKDSEEDTTLSSQIKLKKSISFADECENETLMLTFKHCNVEPSKEPYDPAKGIQKPSDIYDAYSSLFGGSTSILKKTKYDKPPPNIQVPKVQKKEDNELRTIVIKDVIEKVHKCNNKIQSETKPTSLFKKRRQQMKS